MANDGPHPRRLHKPKKTLVVVKIRHRLVALGPAAEIGPTVVAPLLGTAVAKSVRVGPALVASYPPMEGSGIRVFFVRFPLLKEFITVLLRSCMSFGSSGYTDQEGIWVSAYVRRGGGVGCVDLDRRESGLEATPLIKASIDWSTCENTFRFSWTDFGSGDSTGSSRRGHRVTIVNVRMIGKCTSRKTTPVGICRNRIVTDTPVERTSTGHTTINNKNKTATSRRELTSSRGSCSA